MGDRSCSTAPCFPHTQDAAGGWGVALAPQHRKMLQEGLGCATAQPHPGGMHGSVDQLPCSAPSSCPQCGTAPMGTEQPHVLRDRMLLTGSSHTFPSSCLSCPSLGHSPPRGDQSCSSWRCWPCSQLLPGVLPTCRSHSELPTQGVSPWNQAEGKQKALGLQILQWGWN